MKKIGLLSFGLWSASSQSIDLEVAAEEPGADGAYFWVHHFAQRIASPYPLKHVAPALGWR